MLGEFVDDLKLGAYIAGWLGLKREDESEEGPSEAVGEDRLGPKNILSSLGPSLLFLSLIFIIIIALLVMVFFVSRYSRLSGKTHERINKVKRVIFWNPMIRYTMLNALKLYISALVIFKHGWPTDDPT